MALILRIMFAGITFLNYWVGVVPAKGTTLAQNSPSHLRNSQLVKPSFTSFNYQQLDLGSCPTNTTGFSRLFPMLAFNMAKNKYMPRHMKKGDRLGYSNGILTLAIKDCLALDFDGQTES